MNVHARDAREAMYKFASSYSISRQVSLQEAVYYSVPKLWLRKYFPTTVLVNTSIPSERIQICKSVEEMEELKPDSTDIFKRNMIDRYRPNSQYRNWMYDLVDHICFAIFVAHYYLDYQNKDKNDGQPDALGEETKETLQRCSEILPKSLPLMSTSEKLKLRRQVLKYHMPIKHLHPETFAHYLLFIFYPFQDENALKVNSRYCQKLNEKGVLHTINEDKRLFCPSCEEINNAFVRLSQVQNEISDFDNDYLPEKNEEPSLSAGVRCVNTSNVMISNYSMREMIRSLNFQLRHVFNEIYNWCKSKYKYRNSLTKKNVNPLSVFMSHGAGLGKLYLINTIFQTLTRIFILAHQKRLKY